MNENQSYIISKDKLEAAERALADIGLEHFMLLMPADDDGKMSTLFHQMKASDTMNLLVNAIPLSIDHEFQANPQYDKEYRKIFITFKEKFKKLVAQVNTSVERYNTKHTQKENE